MVIGSLMAAGTAYAAGKYAENKKSVGEVVSSAAQTGDKLINGLNERRKAENFYSTPEGAAALNKVARGYEDTFGLSSIK
jgi:uncharacterized protein (DUF927 family)